MSSAVLSPPSPPPEAGLRRVTRNVPTELLRSFVAIAESGSMAQATDIVFLTQSALSLQMKRLEDILQQKLFRRDGRRLVLTAAGEELVAYARELLALNDRIMSQLGHAADAEPIAVGMVQDFADTLLPDVLGRFRLEHPRARLTVRVGGSAELLEHFDRARLDVVLCLGRHADRVGARAQVVGEDRMVWLGDPAIADQAELPLVLLDPPCRFREAALLTLGEARRAYRLVMETPHLPALRAGVRGGLGVSCRTLRFALSEGLPVLAEKSMPPLPRIETLLVHREGLSDEAMDLAGLLAEAAGQGSGQAGAAPAATQTAAALAAGSNDHHAPFVA